MAEEDVDRMKGLLARMQYSKKASVLKDQFSAERTSEQSCKATKLYLPVLACGGSSSALQIDIDATSHELPFTAR